MAATRRRIRLLGHLPLALLGGGVVLWGGCNGSAEAPPTVGAEIIELRAPMAGAALLRPAVAFDHAKHTTALIPDGRASVDGSACGACHGKDDGGRLALGVIDAKLSGEEAMNAYHQLCVGCHRQRSQQGRPSGPAACGDCHARRPPAQSSRQPARYDYSLHARHVGALDKQCKACHHVYDEATKQLVYRKGKEAGCNGCHGAEDDGKKLALRKASHRACIDCHGERARKGQSTGPVLCRGCHDGASRAAYKRLAAGEIPRLKRDDQPDEKAIQTKGTKMAAVAFNHAAHEPRVAFCSTCHHKGTAKKSCGECHSLTGKKQGGGVKLEQAHHLASSGHSCVGCHQQQAQAKQCAGCHHALGQPPSALGCKRCHGGAVKAVALAAPATAPASQPVAGSQPVAVAAAPSPVKPAPLAPLPPVGEDFPETVVIKSLQNKYEPSVLPHRKIVLALDAAVRKSKLARHFHGDSKTLCAGCHHHSPVGDRPPSCASCHGETAQATKDQPKLGAAYHRQCIGCHQKMGLKQVGCTDCHAKTKQARQSWTKQSGTKQSGTNNAKKASSKLAGLR